MYILHIYIRNKILFFNYINNNNMKIQNQTKPKLNETFYFCYYYYYFMI
jgi:hypothetical protein